MAKDMRQIYAALTILLPILIATGVSIVSVAALLTHPKGDPLPPNPHAKPNGDPMPPQPHVISPLPDGGDPLPPTPT